MTFYLVKPGLYGAVYIVTKVPRTGPYVDFERVSPVKAFDWELDARQFWQARTFSTLDAASKALAIVHAAGHTEFAISETPWEAGQ